MRTSLSKTLFCGIAFAAVLLVPSVSNAQQKGVGKVTADKLPSPEISIIGKNKNFRPKDWMEAEVELNLPAANAEQKKAGYFDQITVKWYVAVPNPENPTTTIKLEKDVTHVNVPVGEAVYSSIYLSPNTLKRLTGRDRFDMAQIKDVSVEVMVNGNKIGEGSLKNIAPKWWENPAVSDQSSKFPLLNKNETPFKVLWWDRYAEIEEKH